LHFLLQLKFLFLVLNIKDCIKWGAFQIVVYRTMRSYGTQKKQYALVATRHLFLMEQENKADSVFAAIEMHP